MDIQEDLRDGTLLLHIIRSWLRWFGLLTRTLDPTLVKVFKYVLLAGDTRADMEQAGDIIYLG